MFPFNIRNSLLPVGGKSCWVAAECEAICHWPKISYS